MDIQTFVHKYNNDNPEFKKDLLELLDAENKDFSDKVVESFDETCHKVAMRILIGASIIGGIIIVLFLVFK